MFSFKSLLLVQFLAAMVLSAPVDNGQASSPVTWIEVGEDDDEGSRELLSPVDNLVEPEGTIKTVSWPKPVSSKLEFSSSNIAGYLFLAFSFFLPVDAHLSEKD